jgi:hypothetical protein
MTAHLYRLAALTILTVLLIGCRTKYIPVETIRTQYIVKTDTLLRQDSIILRDSVTVYTKGDTVYTTRLTYKDRLRYIYKAKTDTIHQTDTINNVVTVEVEKKPTAWAKVKQTAGDVALVIVFIGLLFLIWIFIRVVRNR